MSKVLELYGFELKELTNADLTDRSVNGLGTFDCILETVRTNFEDQMLKRAFDSTDVGTLFASLVDSSLSQAVTYLIQKDDSKIKLAQLAMQHETNQVQLEIAKAELEIKLKELEFKEKELEVQLAIAMLNKELIAQKIITEKAQTQDLDDNGDPYTGVAGSQIALNKQQKQAFIDDNYQKIARIYNDNFSIRKTSDEGIDTPSSVDKQAFNEVFKTLTSKSDIDIGTL